MNSTTNFVKWNITLLPFWHLEYFQVSENLSNFFVVLFNIVLRYTKILTNLLIHLSTNTIKFNRLRYDWPNICKFLWFFFWYWSTFNLSGNSMNAFNNINHVLKSIFNVVFQIIFTWIECHMFFFDSNIKQTSFTLFFHLIQQQSHRLMIYAN